MYGPNLWMSPMYPSLCGSRGWNSTVAFCRASYVVSGEPCGRHSFCFPLEVQLGKIGKGTLRSTRHLSSWGMVRSTTISRDHWNCQGILCQGMLWTRRWRSRALMWKWFVSAQRAGGEDLVKLNDHYLHHYILSMGRVETMRLCCKNSHDSWSSMLKFMPVKKGLEPSSKS